MSKYDELVTAFGNASTKDRAFEDECYGFGHRLHAELIRFLGCTQNEVLVLPQEVEPFDAESHKVYEVRGSLKWDKEKSSWGMTFKVQLGRGFLSWPVEFQKAPDGLFVVRVEGAEETRINPSDSEAIHTMFQRWHGALVDDLENGLKRMIDGQPKGLGINSIGFKSGR